MASQRKFCFDLCIYSYAWNFLQKQNNRAKISVLIESLCCAYLRLTHCDTMGCSLPGSSVHGGSPGNNTGLGCHVLLQGIFPTQGSNPGLSQCRRILYCLSHQRSPRIVEWVTYPFFRGSSPPRNWNRVFCIASGFFTSWATWEAHWITSSAQNQINGYILYSVTYSIQIR